MESPKAMKETLFDTIQPKMERKRGKVTIIGAGAVGLACAYSIIQQGIASDLCIIDVPQVEDKVKAEVADLAHGSAFARRCIIKGGSDYALSAHSNLVVVTAGARQNPGESRLDLVGRNLKIFQSIIPQVMKHSPETLLMIVSNPVDIMTAVAQRLSGLPVGKVFGSGTALDSSRFRTLIADRLHVDPRSVHGSILGEHGDSSVAQWSGIHVGGVRLRDLNPLLGTKEDPDNWEAIHKQVIGAAGEIIKAKGYTNWAIGATVASLCEAVLRNEHRVSPLSVPVHGKYGIEDDVYLSLPAVLGAEGITDVLTVKLEPAEEEKLRHSARTIAAVQNSLVYDTPAGGAGAGHA